MVAPLQTASAFQAPAAAQYILEISPEHKTVNIFGPPVGAGWGKWSGGVLANSGKIYGIPALATSILEIDVNSGTATPYGMLPGGKQLQDKWNGGVLAPNGVPDSRDPSSLSCGA